MSEPSSVSLSSIADQLLTDYPLLADRLCLEVGACCIELRTNSEALLNRLQYYFRHILAVTPAISPESIQVTALQAEPPALEQAFQDWRREPGKTGRKDSYCDLPGGRLVRKVRTGMLFLQQASVPMAIGDCLANDNQVINFINAQYMNWLQQRGWLICHAAAVECGGKAIAVAAFSGGGKSTLMLRLMDDSTRNFLTNDRLFIIGDQQYNFQASGVKAAGIPKLPRINPGTIVTNPLLEPIIPEQRRQQLMQLPQSALWDLEEKYDVDVQQIYGNNRIRHNADLGAFLVLNWQRNTSPMSVAAVDLDQRRDLLAAVMKSSGPFYQQADGEFSNDQVEPDAQRYIDALKSVPVFEVSGGIDFDGLVNWCDQSLV